MYQPDIGNPRNYIESGTIAMQYHHVSYEQLETFCHEVFKGYHFTEEESCQITDVLLAADRSSLTEFRD